MVDQEEHRSSCQRRRCVGMSVRFLRKGTEILRVFFTTVDVLMKYRRYLFISETKQLISSDFATFFYSKSLCVVFDTIVPPCGRERHCGHIDTFLLTIYFPLFFIVYFWTFCSIFV